MNFTKQQKDIAVVVLASFLLIMAVGFTYFSVYSPAKESKLQMERSLASEQEVLMALQNQLQELPEGERINPLELQQKITVEPLTDKVLLQVEQAELLSNTLIKSVGFTEEPFEIPVPVEGVENVQQLIATVELEAVDYEGITAFIKEIEAMKRIMIVEAINFNSNPEQTQLGEQQEPLAVSLQFSAFYRPDLIALSDTAPKVDAPAPANKNNPMPQNDGTYLVTEAAAEDDAEEEEQQEETVQEEEDTED